MICVFRLVLILALSFGAVIAPDVSSANISDTAMAQMGNAESADGRCDGCDPAGFSDVMPCESGCLVPCGSSGTAGILAEVLPARIAMPFGPALRVAEPLIPLGAILLLDPFPPKLPV